MIRIYLFQCEKCGYVAHVAGGPSGGRDLETQTIVCEDCKELQDAVTALRVRDTDANPPQSAPLFADVVNRLFLTGQTHWQKFEPACSVSPQHGRIKLWKQPGKCPRCGAFMEPAGIPLRQWD